jgi:N-acetylmuramoyl-L-alanine amidase
MKALLLLFALSLSAQAETLVMIDPGHEPSRPGAIGVCGKEEMAYNDQAAGELLSALEKSGLRATLTRAPGTEMVTPNDSDRFLPEAERASWANDPRLYERAAVANRLGASLFLSLHHDSTNAKYQEATLSSCGGQPGKRLNASFAKDGNRVGFSVFVTASPANPARYQASLKLAKAIGRGLVEKMKRVPNNHKSLLKECGSCKVIDAKYGVFQKTLAVLRSTEMPAVLLEVGVIVDEADEKLVNTNAYRRKMATVLRDAIKASLPRNP